MFEENENQALDNDIEDGGQGEVVETREEEETESPADSAGESEEEREPGDAGREQQKTEQSHQDNAAARAARIRAEQETTQRLQREFDEQVAGMGIPNPYTGKPFESFAEFREYGEKFRREQLTSEAKQKGTTVEALEEELENRAFLARKRKEEKAQKDAATEEQKRAKFIQRDLSEFVGSHPDVDVEKLEKNAKFIKFVGDRLYRVPLGQLYDDFVEIVGDVERTALERTALKQSRSTGGGQGGGADMLTPAQRRELDEWNSSNPEMRMTPKEFLN